LPGELTVFLRGHASLALKPLGKEIGWDTDPAGDLTDPTVLIGEEFFGDGDSEVIEVNEGGYSDALSKDPGKLVFLDS